MEDITHSQLVLKHLNAMHAARKAFIEAESNEKLRKALKSKARVTTGLIYDLGDLVYYKRKDSDKWKGPGKFIGKENKKILVKACVRNFSLFLKAKCISLIFRMKYIENKFNLQLFFLPIVS